MPKDLLDGIEDTNIETTNTSYDWEYGTSRKIKEKPFNDKYSKPKEEFKFRTAESFLNSLNKTADIDLSKFAQGQRVYHKKFGEGTISNLEPEGNDMKVDIDFDKVGHKRLMAKFAGLEIIE